MEHEQVLLKKHKEALNQVGKHHEDEYNRINSMMTN